MNPHQDYRFQLFTLDRFHRLISFVLVFGLFIFTSLTLHAQNLVCKNYGMNEGLPSNVISQLFQDSRGYLWVGTEEGISRFDGVSFINFSTGEDGTRIGYVFNIIESEEGHIWLCTNGNGVFEIIDHRVIHYSIGQHPDANIVGEIISYKPGHLLLSTNDGLFELVHGKPIDCKGINKTAFQFGDIRKDEKGQIWMLDTNSITRFNPYTKKCEGHSILHEKNEKFNWVKWLVDNQMVTFSNNGRIARIYSKNKTHELRCPDGISIVGMVQDKNHHDWFYTNNGILVTEENHPSLENGIWFTTKNGLIDNSVNAMLCDKDGNIWMGSEGKGLSKLEDPNTLSFSFSSHGLSVMDRYMGIWNSCSDGIQVIRKKNNGEFNILHVEIQGPSGSINPVALGFYNQGNNLLVLSEKGEVFAYEILYGDQIKLKYVWRIAANRKDNTGFMSIYLYVDSKSRLWLFGDNKQLYVYDIRNRNPKYVGTYPYLIENHVTLRTIVEDHNGHLWMGGFGDNLIEVDSNLHLKHVYHQPGGITLVGIRSSLCASDGTLWFGSRADGLIRMKNGKFERFTTKDGLVSNSVISLYEDSQHILWYGSRAGIGYLRETPKGFLYGIKQGLPQSPVVTIGFLNDGTLWINNGFEVVTDKQPHSFLTNPQYIPPVVIHSCLINGSKKVFLDEKEHVFHASENNLNISFGSICLRKDLHVSYSYRFEGKTEWSAPGALRTVNFVDLTPGDYVFQVKAVTAEGVESKTYATFHFVILKPIWQRWWFLLSMILIPVMIIGMQIRLRINRMLEIERLKGKIAADLHDDIGSGLTHIALATEILLRKKDHASNQSMYHRIGETARELVEKMNDIVWSIDPKNDSIEKVMSRILTFTNEICEEKGIQCEFHYDKKMLGSKLGSGIVSCLLLIAKEAVTNALRHSNCSQLYVSISKKNGFISLEIKDNGQGFNENQLNRINGLINMRVRAEKLKGQCIIQSESGNGTLVKVDLPLHS